MSQSGIFLHRVGWENIPRFGGGGGTTTSTQKSDPWTGQQPYLLGGVDSSGQSIPGLFSTAAALFKANTPEYFQSSTYQPMLPSQQSAYNSAYNFGITGGPGSESALSANRAMLDPAYTSASRGAYNAVNPVIGGLGSGAFIWPAQGAFESGQKYLADTISGTGTAQTSPTFGQAQNYLSGMIGGNGVAPMSGAAMQNQNLLSREIGGAYLDPSSDPGFQAVVNKTLANVVPAIETPFISAGRANSGLAARALSSGVTDAIGGLTLQNYLAERQNQIGAGQQAAQNLLAQQGLQQGAAGQSIQSQLAERGLQQGAAQQAAQNLSSMIGSAETAQGLAANTMLGQQGQQIQAQAIAPTIDQGVLSNLNTAAQASGMSQQDLQNQINAEIQKWNYQQMLPWNQLGLYNSMIQGNYGGTTTTTQPYYSNQGANIAAGIGGAASIAASVAAII